MECVVKNDDISQFSTMKQCLNKCFLITKNIKIRITGIRFYKFIYDHTFYKVEIEDHLFAAIISSDNLPSDNDINEEEIKFTLIKIPYKECKNNNIPLEFYQLIRLKRDHLSRYEIA